MSQAKTAAQRQAERSQRMRAAGLVRFARWVHPESVATLDSVIERLDQIRLDDARERAEFFAALKRDVEAALTQKPVAPWAANK